MPFLEPSRSTRLRPSLFFLSTPFPSRLRRAGSTLLASPTLSQCLLVLINQDAFFKKPLWPCSLLFCSLRLPPFLPRLLFPGRTAVA